jgi:hypothetical protein
LLPFAVNEKVQGHSLIDWLLFSQNHSKRKYKFLTLLTLNINLFIKKEGYSYLSLADYVCARIIRSLVEVKEDLEWTSFSALYLSQVRKFSEYCTSAFSQSNKENLIDFFEKVIAKAGPLEYINISEFLYIHYKKRILDNLRRKYKFTGSQS